MTISNQEIEIERLKTTVIALNAKCAIVDDHRYHAENTAVRHTESETKRVELHTEIKKMSEQVHGHAEEQKGHRDDLHANIQELN